MSASTHSLYYFTIQMFANNAHKPLSGRDLTLPDEHGGDVQGHRLENVRVLKQAFQNGRGH